MIIYCTNKFYFLRSKIHQKQRRANNKIIKKKKKKKKSESKIKRRKIESLR